MCGPHQVWPLRSECCGRGVPTKVVCAECMKMCCLGGKNSVVKGLNPVGITRQGRKVHDHNAFQFLVIFLVSLTR